MLGRIAMALEGVDVGDAVRVLLDKNLCGGSLEPHELAVDLEPVEPSSDWMDRYLGSERRVSAYFGPEGRHFITTDPSVPLVRVGFDAERSVEDLVGLLSQVRFEVASFETFHSAWVTKRKQYGRIPGFGNGHFKHGWACAFQGDGHNRLASRRWLDHGPWRLVRGAKDTALVQFHDLDLDVDSAFAQARPCHYRMGIADEGGYLQEPYVYKHGFKGFYDQERRVVEVVVTGREVSALEMRDAAAARRFQKLGPEQPIDNVAFVFLDPREAPAYLPKLWLYGLECWTIVDEVKTRLDTGEPPEGVDA